MSTPVRIQFFWLKVQMLRTGKRIQGNYERHGPGDEKALADEAREADEDEMQVQLLCGDEQGCAIAPATDQIVVARLGDEHEMGDVQEPWNA